jgi:hypothetical protein
METFILMPILRQYNITDLDEKIQDYVEMSNYSYSDNIYKENENHHKSNYHKITLKNICINHFEISFGYPFDIYIKQYEINSDTYIEPNDQFFYDIINPILYGIISKRYYNHEETHNTFHKKGNKYKLLITFHKLYWCAWLPATEFSQGVTIEILKK